MRIISQNGEVDIPYINSVIRQYGSKIEALNRGIYFTLGVYENKDEAAAVMRFIRGSYLRDKKLYKMPSQEEVTNG